MKGSISKKGVGLKINIFEQIKAIGGAKKNIPTS